ncbi:MAG: DpnD/PcfM family protein [Synergistaceae bacterium]|nr:DpnD/PcfM family protein [Synergistaceae bacterium]
MKSYEVKITETLRKTVTVEAHDYDEAIDKVREAWRRSEYVLNADDFLEAGFEIVGVQYS